MNILLSLLFHVATYPSLLSVSLHGFPFMSFSAFLLPTTPLDYSWSFSFLVISPICLLCLWSVKWWCSSYLFRSRKKMSECFYWANKLGFSLFYLQKGSGILPHPVYQIIMYPTRSVLTTDWNWHPFSCQEPYKVLQFTYVQLSAFIDYVPWFLVHTKLKCDLERFLQIHCRLKIMQICMPR